MKKIKKKIFNKRFINVLNNDKKNLILLNKKMKIKNKIKINNKKKEIIMKMKKIYKIIKNFLKKRLKKSGKNYKYM